MGLGVMAAAVAPGAAGQALGLHVRGEAALAYTDNLFGVPSGAAVDRPGPLRIWFLELSPGLELYRDAPLSRYLVSYAHPFTSYLGRSAADSQSDVASARGIFVLSERDELTASLQGARTTSALASLQGVAGGEALQLSGDSHVLSSSLTELWRHELSDTWQQTQSFELGALRQSGGGSPAVSRWDVSAGWLLEVLSAKDAWGLRFDATWAQQSTAASATVPTAEEQRELLLGVAPQWRRDLSRTLSSTLSGGVVAAKGFPRGVAVRPVAGAALDWTRPPTHAQLALTRTVAPSLIAARVMTTDSAQASADWSVLEGGGLRLETLHRLSESRIVVLSGGESTQRVRGWTSSVTGLWVPGEPWPTLQVRYEHFQQFDSGGDAPHLPEFARNLFMVSLVGRWPGQDIEEVPVAAPSRVDGQDRDPLAPGLDAAALRAPSRGTTEPAY